MAFCINCGNELSDGAKFCPNCGAAVNDNAEVTIQQRQEQPDHQHAMNVPSQPVQSEQKSSIDRFGKFFGIILLIVAILCLYSDPPLVTIILAGAIIAGAIFCLNKKYKLKGFTIAALIIAALCMFAGTAQAKRYGLLKIPVKAESVAKTETINETVKDDIPVTDTIDSVKDSKTTSTDNGSKTEQLRERDQDKEQVKPSATEKKKSGGVDPDLKAFLDSYEEFVDEYVAFMKKYMADPANAVSMLVEYTEMMAKYEDFAEKVDQYDSDSMSTEDAKYYIEVTSRCSKKLLDIY